MSEQQLTDDQALALAGTIDGDTDFEHHTVGQSTYYLDGLRQRHLVLKIIKIINALRVYKDGSLTFGVRAGSFMNGDTVVNYAGSAAQALTNNQTNYVYLTSAGVLTVNTTGFPVQSAAPHIPLATIVTAAGDYTPDDDLVDYRTLAMFAPSVVFAGRLEASLADNIPFLTITGADNADGTGTMSIQAKDAAANNLAERVLVRVWFSDTAAYAAPAAATTDFSVATGTQIREITADSYYEAITDATGLVEMTIDDGADGTYYVSAEIDGRVYSGSVTITGT